MTIDQSDRVKDLFTGSTRDLTPASSRHTARVLFVPTSQDPEVSKLCASVLSEAERRRAERFAGDDHRARFEQRRAFRRFCGAAALGSSQPLSAIRFATTESGRPYIAEAPDLWFSFSSCRLGMLGAWSSTHGIGVDIEDQTRAAEAPELARRFFTAAEADAIQGLVGVERSETFFRFWTLKEAALKSIGEGLPFGLDAFEFELKPVPCVVQAPVECGGPARFDASLIEGTDGCVALVIRGMD